MMSAMLSLLALLGALVQPGSALIPCWKGHWCAKGWKCREQICTFNWFQKCKYCIWESWGRDEETDASASVFDASRSEGDANFASKEDFLAALEASKLADGPDKAAEGGEAGARAEVDVSSSMFDKGEQVFKRAAVPVTVAVTGIACLVTAVVKVVKPFAAGRRRGLLAAAA